MADENPYAPPEADVEVAASGEAGLASRWARLGAAVIDGLISTILVMALVFLTGMWNRMMANEQSLADSLLMMAVAFVGFVAIHGYLLATQGQTVGKRMLGIRIVSTIDGSLLPLWKLILIRYLVFGYLGLIPLIGPVLSLVNILFIFRADRRCIHDHAAGTRVVKADAPVVRTPAG